MCSSSHPHYSWHSSIPPILVDFLLLLLAVSARELHQPTIHESTPLSQGSRRVQPASLCPPESSFTERRDSIDVTSGPGTLVSTSTSQVQYRMTTGKKRCIEAAVTFSCWTQKDKSFFLYARDGVLVEGKKYNCVFGTACGLITPKKKSEGGTSAQFGYLKTGGCSPPKIRCPEKGKDPYRQSIEASLADTIDYNTGKSATYSITKSADECKDLGRRNSASFFLFSLSGFKRSGVVRGNCVHSTNCVGFFPGPDTVTLGVP